MKCAVAQDRGVSSSHWVGWCLLVFVFRGHLTRYLEIGGWLEDGIQIIDACTLCTLDHLTFSYC